MSTENLSSKILLQGQTIALANGETVTIKYGFAALAVIEREYGSIQGLVAKLSDTNGEVISTLGYALWAGTSRNVAVEAFLDLLDPRKIQEYSEAFGTALSDAMPPGDSTPGEAKAATEAAKN